MLRRPISLVVIITFVFSLVGPYKPAHADVLGLPTPGAMVNLSSAYEPTLIKGITVHKDNPFLFDFIVDTGHSGLSGDALKSEGDRLVKYFFACLTVPEKDLWVNLSPYEKDRMIPYDLGQTALGRDLLAQDYILKQLTASLIYPEKNLGKEFWNRVYAKAQQEFGTTQIPVSTFNKVWIIADKASVYEHGQTAFVLDGHLKVMLEEDYLALTNHQHSNQTHSITSQIIRQIILPELEKEVNTGKNFAMLRQIFYSQMLATWYKKNLKEALLNQVYTNKSIVNGVNLNDPSVKEQIYQQYLQAYKKGVFNYIKEEGSNNGQMVPRKYFSGGTRITTDAIETFETSPSAGRAVQRELNSVVDLQTVVRFNRAPAIQTPSSAAMIGSVEIKNVLDQLSRFKFEQRVISLEQRELIKKLIPLKLQPRFQMGMAPLYDEFLIRNLGIGNSKNILKFISATQRGVDGTIHERSFDELMQRLKALQQGSQKFFQFEINFYPVIKESWFIVSSFDGQDQWFVRAENPMYFWYQKEGYPPGYPVSSEEDRKFNAAMTEDRAGDIARRLNNELSDGYDDYNHPGVKQGIIAATIILLTQGLQQEEAENTAQRISSQLNIGYNDYDYPWVKGGIIVATAILMGKGLDEQRARAVAEGISGQLPIGYNDYSEDGVKGSIVVKAAVLMKQGFGEQQAIDEARKNSGSTVYSDYRDPVKIAMAALKNAAMTIQKAIELLSSSDFNPNGDYIDEIKNVVDGMLKDNKIADKLSKQQLIMAQKFETSILTAENRFILAHAIASYISGDKPTHSANRHDYLVRRLRAISLDPRSKTILNEADQRNMKAYLKKVDDPRIGYLTHNPEGERVYTGYTELNNTFHIIKRFDGAIQRTSDIGSLRETLDDLDGDTSHYPSIASAIMSQLESLKEPRKFNTNYVGPQPEIKAVQDMLALQPAEAEKLTPFLVDTISQYQRINLQMTEMITILFDYDKDKVAALIESALLKKTPNMYGLVRRVLFSFVLDHAKEPVLAGVIQSLKENGDQIYGSMWKAWGYKKKFNALPISAAMTTKRGNGYKNLFQLAERDAYRIDEKITLMGRFDKGGDIAGLHAIRPVDTRTTTVVTINAGLIPEFKDAKGVDEARADFPEALLAQTVNSNEDDVSPDADILVGTYTLSEDRINALRESARRKGREIIIFSQIDPRFAKAKEFIDEALKYGADGIKLKPAAGAGQDKTLELISYLKVNYPRVRIIVAGGINNDNRLIFGKDVKAGVGIDNLDDLRTKINWPNLIKSSSAMITPAQIEKITDFKPKELLRIAYEKQGPGGKISEIMGEYVGHDLKARTLTAVIKNGPQKPETRTFYFDNNDKGDQLLGIERYDFNIKILEKTRGDFELNPKKRNPAKPAGGDVEFKFTKRVKVAPPEIKIIAKKRLGSGDAAMNGGIDLNSANMAMTVTKDANGGVHVNFNPALIAQIRRRGVYSAIPVIVSVTSMSTAQIDPLLGIPQ